MKTSMPLKIETAANVAIIVVAVLVCIEFMPRLLPKSQATAIKIGSRMSLSAPNRPGSDRQILFLVMSTECHYCTESAEFYRQIISEADKEKTSLMAVFPQSAVQAKIYLEAIGLHLDVVQAPLSSIGVVGTPTLILVDKGGLVKRFWMGRLSTSEEYQVLSALRYPG